MSGHGGAGASVSSGAGFQARVAAFALVSSICEIETVFGPATAIEQVGFETRTNIDDLNLLFKDGSRSYIQAKATIGFSLDGELRSVFQQFEEQDAAGGKEERYLLVTSGRAVKNFTNDLRLALDAFRSSPEAEFLRDQPQAIKEVIEAVRRTLNELRVAAKRDVDVDAVDRIIRKSKVIILDVEAEDTLEQSTILLLQMRKYVAPSGVWGKAIADCITFAKARRTIAVADIAKDFEKFRVATAEMAEKAAGDILQVELGGVDFPCGKEVVLARALDDELTAKGQSVVLEMRRFDGRCGELLDFTAMPFRPNGRPAFDIILRAATVKGLMRLIRDRPGIITGDELGVVELETNEDLEADPCVAAHRQRLHNAFQKNDKPLRCLHCAEAVWEPVAEVVELGSLADPQLGLVHKRCLQPTDRVIGEANMPMAEKHPELVNFDANAWFKASNGGQRTLANLDTLRTGPVAHIAWGGLAARGPLGQFLVEVSLKDGGSEIVTRRNVLHRFTKMEAEEFAEELNASFDHQRKIGDPMCFTDQSKGFAPRSILIEQFGNREKRREVSSASVRPYDQKLVALYSQPGQWYAPLLYLRHTPTGYPVAFGEGIMFLTNPATVKDHLENWAETGFEVEDYEIVAILTDAEFDDFMSWADAQEMIGVVDALFKPSSREIASGAIIMSIERISAIHGDG
ncbi:hypothetical protein NKY71_27140 [Sinorhizobium meliloti]|uniref:hypothetical protein n=1 Tax=Rhizobium meliloti TaxID=382 RepID=UPI003D64C29F